MLCYNCGYELSDKPFCTACGVDVSVYKKIMHISNRFYNDGLEKATVRDLSGAILSLRQSLKFNKNNVEARNLLGLIYFELGEPVAALSEWVISKNIRPQKNIADDYINDVQSNPTRLDTINQTIKKYNQALEYCHSGSPDLAIIQLKKVVQLNPRFVKALQLLALLYLDSEEWERAKKMLDKSLRVDINNTVSLRYLKEAQFMTVGDEVNAPPKRQKSALADDVITYRSGNETIIQPAGRREPIVSSNFVVNLLIGLAIGVAACYFLIVPARIQSAKADLNDQVKTISENADQKTAQITDLQQQLATLNDEKQKLTDQIGAYTGEGGQAQTVDGLLDTANAYIVNPEDYGTLGDRLSTIDKSYVSDSASEAYRNLYTSLITKVGPSIAQSCYDNGTSLVNQGDYSNAIVQLQKAWYFNSTDAAILYALADAYQKSGDQTKANELYSQLISTFPNSEYAQRAQMNVASAGTVRNGTTVQGDEAAPAGNELETTNVVR